MQSVLFENYHDDQKIETLSIHILNVHIHISVSAITVNERETEQDNKEETQSILVSSLL